MNFKKLRDEEIEKLSQKAREFEDFMRSQTTKCGSFDSSKASSPASSNDAATEASGIQVDNENNMNMRVREIETKTREEMARLYTQEIKSLERKYSHEFEQMKKRIVSLALELDESNEELLARREQLEMLKFTILHERETSKQLLSERDAELEQCHAKIEEIASRRQEHDEILEVERESFEALKNHYQEELQHMRIREKEHEDELRKIQQETAKTVKELKEQCSISKRTAINYKKYSDDKENYYKKESQRILEKFKENAELFKSNYDKKLKDKIENLETMYEMKIRKIEDEHELQVDMLKKLLRGSSHWGTWCCSKSCRCWRKTHYCKIFFYNFSMNKMKTKQYFCYFFIEFFISLFLTSFQFAIDIVSHLLFNSFKFLISTWNRRTIV